MDWTQLSVLADVARINAATLGDKPALVSARRTLGFAELNRRMNRLNHALAARGLQKGARVAILSRNRPEYLEVYGVAKNGLLAVPLNWRLTPRELLHPLRDSRSEAVVVEPAYAPTIEALRAELPALKHVILLDDERDGWTNYETLLASSADGEPDAVVLPEDPAAIVYTSGTTGLPKGAVLTHRGLLRNCRAAIDGVLGLGADDVGLAVMPMFHVGGMWYHLFPSYASGGTTVMHAEFNAAAVLEAIRVHRVTHVHIVPTMIAALLDQPGVESADLGRLRLIKYAASSIPLAVLKRAQQVFKGCGLVQSFGSTEAGIGTVLTPADHEAATRDPSMEKLLLSCGRPCTDAQVEIRRLTGGRADIGEIGDIAVRSDRIMAHYWNNPEATRQALQDGWLFTGDLGVIDEQGYLSIVDRKNDMIVSGGENVYPREVEDILYEDPDLAEAAVFALPDPKWVERVAAAVVLKPGHTTTAEAIRTRAATRLAGYKCPKTIFFVDSLPKNATGKVLKKELRRQYGATGAEPQR